MFLFHLETNAFSIACLHTTGSLKFSENRKSYRETSLDMSGENRKWVIRQSYDISSTNQKRTHKLFFPINLSEVSAF